jgi:hypothetical protein
LAPKNCPQRNPTTTSKGTDHGLTHKLTDPNVTKSQIKNW